MTETLLATAAVIIPIVLLGFIGYQKLRMDELTQEVEKWRGHYVRENTRELFFRLEQEPQEERAA